MGVSVPGCPRQGWAGPRVCGPSQRTAEAQVEDGALRAGWGTADLERGERIGLLARWLSQDPLGGLRGRGQSPAHTAPRAADIVSVRPPEDETVSAVCDFIPSRHLIFPEFSRRDSLAGEDGLAAFHKALSGARLGGRSAPGRPDRRRPPPPRKAPSAHPQTEFAKCSSKAINTVQGGVPHLFLNKTHSGGLVYSQTAGSVNDPEPRLPVTQMAVDKDLASCSKCQGCQWG